METPTTTTEQREYEKHGPYEATLYHYAFPGRATNVIASGCLKCEKEQQERKEAEALERSRRERAGNVAWLKRNFGVPLRFAEADFTAARGETPETRSAIAAAKKFADQFPDAAAGGQWLVFIGPPGTGKTHTAAAIGRVAIEKHLAKALYTTAADMARTMRETFRRDCEHSEQEVFDSFAAAELLIIDEVGTGTSQHDRTLLFEVIDARYAEGLPGVLISNLPARELEQYLGERAFDRLAEISRFLAVTGASKRKRSGSRESCEAITA